MEKVIILVVLSLFITVGCSHNGDDQKVRQKLFFKCLDISKKSTYTPSGWAKVIEECGAQARWMSVNAGSTSE